MLLNPFHKDAKNTQLLLQEIYSLMEKIRQIHNYKSELLSHLTNQATLSHPTGFWEKGVKLAWFLSTPFTNDKSLSFRGIKNCFPLQKGKDLWSTAL